jgi:hypothetical protein
MLLTTRYPKFVATYISIAGLLICFAQYIWASPAPVDLNIVAHQDDDILFMNPDILNSVVMGHRQVTVYITAGNIGLADADFGLGPDPEYPLAREEGAIAGYSKLLQLADAIKADPNHFERDFNAVSPSPTPVESFNTGDSRAPVSCATTSFACAEHACELTTAGDARGQRAQMKIGSRTLNVATIGDGPDGPRVLLIFLRVDSPSSVDGVTPPVDMAQLFTSPNHKLQIRSRFNQPGFTKQQLITQLVQILQLVQPDSVRTQDTADGILVDSPNAKMIDDHRCPHTPPFPTSLYDHTDHVWGARFAREALKTYDNLLNVKLPTSYSMYMGYNVEWNEPTDPGIRLTTSDFCLKKSIFYRYALHDNAASILYPASAGFDTFSYENIGYQETVQPPPPLP